MICTRQSVTVCFAIIASVALASASDPETNLVHSKLAAALGSDGNAVQTRNLQPFTNIVYLPVGADLSSIRFESAKALQVATKRTAIANSSYCESNREPGGSMFCPATQDGAIVRAYQVTYSFQGQPIASDETGGTRFTFDVYFHAEDLTPALRQAIAAGRMQRSEAEAFFGIKTHRDDTHVALVDKANSTFCDITLIDGTWTQADPKCLDKVTYKTATVPVSYITVQVDSHEQSVAAAKGPQARK